MTAKVGIILHAGAETHEGLARALHSLLYSKELAEAGIPVHLIFDGAGSEWAAKLYRPGEDETLQRLSRLFQELSGMGVVHQICDYCSGAFGVKEVLQQAAAPLVAEYMDHPSVATLVKQDYQIWIL